jgi:predicted DNA-binding protein (MmcQ/YjbR family)
VPAPYLARAEWVALQDNSVMKASELKPLLRAAYELIVAKLPKKTRQSLASA